MAKDAAVSAETQEQAKELRIKVLGRTLEHFGVQMYKRREAAIAELVANCWDAGAKNVTISVPLEKSYNSLSSEIKITDDGVGMTFEHVKNAYLVLGRNRREDAKHNPDVAEVAADEGNDTSHDGNDATDKIDGLYSCGRRVMGRKGIGKLAGFGLAKNITVTTWRDKSGLEFYLDLDKLKVKDGSAEDVAIKWESVTPKSDKSPSGTEIVMMLLKHKTPLDVEKLKLSLARRFSRSIKGQMSVKVNPTPPEDPGDLPDPTPPLIYRFPTETDLESIEVAPGKTVRYWYGFAEDVIKERELRGFSILVNGKIAQVPPFFFDVEATASGQHSTKYVIGEIEADFLDAGTDDESDVISTDRQEIDWEDEEVKELKKWGEKLSRKVLAECRDLKGTQLVKEVLSDPDLNARIERLDSHSKKQIREFLSILGNNDIEKDRNLELAGALVRAYEFRHFHNVIKDIQEAAADPNKLAAFLAHLQDWKVLESRAILEIIQGRLKIIDEFEQMIVNNAPETAHRTGDTNMHDAIARFPWLLNPEWQVLVEEKTITKTLRDWHYKDFEGKDQEERERYDFLALGDEGQIIIIELKRSAHAVELEETQRLALYKEKLARAHERPIKMVLLYGGALNVNEGEKYIWKNSPDRELREWSKIFARSRKLYKRHEALLESVASHRDFAVAEEELRHTRKVLETGSMFRGKAARKTEGLGPQDMEFGNYDDLKADAVKRTKPIAEWIDPSQILPRDEEDDEEL